ncbi:MAG: ATP-binding cassette domain-containing protein [Burkholderiaceae bacterium]
MALLSLLGAELSFGDTPLLDNLDLFVESRERIGLIGRNGTGKSSLLSVINSRRDLDDGDVRIADGTRIVSVEQEPELPPADSLGESLQQRMGLDDSNQDRDYWQSIAALAASAERLGVALDAPLPGLSGGERKRAALAAALACQPDLLLLDEPTNHLDIAAIEQLEGLLVKGPTLIVITHDRRFLDAVATRIVELDRGNLRSYPGNFTAYEKRKSEQLEEEKEINRKFDKFWKQEEVWIRQGVQARRTRNEGRVRRLQALRKERDSRRERLGSVKLTLDSGERSGKLVVQLENVSKSYPLPPRDGVSPGERRVIDDFSMIIGRGDKIGLIGPNGAGKSTLLRLLTGQEQPDTGKVKLGTNLNIAYFDQMRAQLNDNETVVQTISPGSDWIEIGTERKHVISYLGDFLFSPRRAQSPVASLSGGERNRLLLARLFAQPSNLLVLDEPTNDLDIESLDVLEATLDAYKGTLLLVSHDRAFLDQVVTQTIAFEGNGHWREYAGGYSDWLSQGGRPIAASAAAEAQAMARGAAQREAAAKPTQTPKASPASAPTPKRVKLSYKEQRELDNMAETIEALETEQSALNEKMSQPDYFKSDTEQQRVDQSRAAEIDQQLSDRLERWELLEAKANGTVS